MRICRLWLLPMVAVFLGIQLGFAQNAEELNVITKKWMRYSDSPNLLYHHLAKESFQLLDKEAKSLAQVRTKSDWQKRQAAKKEAIWQAIGKFPANKTPLNVRITSTIHKDTYRIENIIYESLPNYFVTASLFIPNQLANKAPAILFCSGHSAQAYRRDIYQIPLLNLVNKGFVVLAIDPVSQGERLQYFDAVKQASAIGGSTSEHSYPAPQAFLIGQSVARYFVWDGIRAIDYLVSRPEVDAERIGVHGLSGGGTQTAYIAALDERVKAAAPAGYITGYKRLIESIGVQDGEQNFFHGLKSGIDHADFIEIRAPKPTLIMATTSDFFNISGTRDVYSRVKRAYAAFGKAENVDMVEGDYVHGYTQNIREHMYAFFQKHLNLPGSSKEDSLTLLTEKELQKTSTGQLATSEKFMETVQSLNEKEATQYIDRLATARQNLTQHLAKVKGSVGTIAGVRVPTTKEQAVFTGRIVKENYHIERYFIEGEGDYPVPFLLYKPLGAVRKVAIYVHPEGKSKANTALIEKLLAEEIAVVVPDLLGTGELAPINHKGDATIQGVSYNIWFTSVLNGRSIVGFQASDLLRLKKSIQGLYPAAPFSLISQGQMSPTILHATAVVPEFDNIVLLNPYSSYQSIVEQNFYQPTYVFSMVAGALKQYDLPDLAALLAPKKLWIANTVDGNGKAISQQTSKQNYGIVLQAYQQRGKEEAFRLDDLGNDNWQDLANWLK